MHCALMLTGQERNVNYSPHHWGHIVHMHLNTAFLSILLKEYGWTKISIFKIWIVASWLSPSCVNIVHKLCWYTWADEWPTCEEWYLQIDDSKICLSEVQNTAIARFFTKCAALLTLSLWNCDSWGVSHLIIQKSEYCSFNNKNWTVIKDSTLGNCLCYFHVPVGSGHFSCFSSKVQSRCIINFVMSMEIVFPLPSWQAWWEEVLAAIWPSFISTYLCTAITPSLAYLRGELLLL